MLEHAAALDEEALGAEHLAELIELLHERNQQTSSEAGLKAGSLLLGLMFDVFEVWSPPPRERAAQAKGLPHGAGRRHERHARQALARLVGRRDLARLVAAQADH